MSRRPICVKCQIELACDRNGVVVVDRGSQNEVFGFVRTDLYKCPTCGIEVIVGFGRETPSHSSGFEQELVAMADAGQPWLGVWRNQMEKGAANIQPDERIRDNF